MSIGIRITDVPGTSHSDRFEVRIRNGQYWLVGVFLSLAFAGMRFVTPDEAGFITFFGIGMAVSCLIFWFQARRTWRRFTIEVDGSEIRGLVTGGGNPPPIAIDPDLQVAVEKTSRRTRAWDDGLVIETRYDVLYGSRTIVRDVESKKGADEISERISAAIARSRSGAISD